MSSPLTIKVVVGTEIRRITFAKPPTYQTLAQMIANLFNISLERVKPILYRDDGSPGNSSPTLPIPFHLLPSSHPVLENDVVTIGTDIELLEAIRVAEVAKTSLRLYVNRIEAGAEAIEDSVPTVVRPAEISSAPLQPVASAQPVPSAPILHAADAPSVRDAAILQELSQQLDQAVAKLKDVYSRAEVQKHFDTIKTAAQRELQSASDTIKPYLVALQVYASSHTDARMIESLQHLVASMQLQSKRLVEQAQNGMQNLPAFQSSSFAPLQQVPAQLAAFPGQIAQLPAQVSANLPAQIAALPGQIASIPAQIAAYFPAAAAAAPPAAASSASSSQLPPDAVQQDLKALESMGFTDTARNIKLLFEHKGNLEAVVSELLCD